MPWKGGTEFRGDDAVRLVRHRMLGTDAVYRVGRSSGELVEVEVVAAPALTPGMRLRLTTASVRAMAKPVVRRRSERPPPSRGTLVLRAVLAMLPVSRSPAA